jgi:phosphoribosyl 1,2-cyclic phosphate phosphodiesterase
MEGGSSSVPAMRLTFLGTGTSFGVPVVGCRCETCTSEDPRDRRTRHGALLDLPEGRLLVDAPPELRLQLLGQGVGAVDAVWITHAHADHVHGIDDLRIFSARKGLPLPAYVSLEHQADLHARFPYIFDSRLLPPAGTTRPELRLEPLPRSGVIDILGARFLPLRLPHGPVSVYGFRVGALGYVTDAKALPEDVLTALDGVEVLVINALWFGDPHPTHFNVEEALEAADAVGARRTYLTHMTHRLRHADMLSRLPRGVVPAYDGLSTEI